MGPSEGFTRGIGGIGLQGVTRCIKSKTFGEDTTSSVWSYFCQGIVILLQFLLQALSTKGVALSLSAMLQLLWKLLSEADLELLWVLEHINSIFHTKFITKHAIVVKGSY